MSEPHGFSIEEFGHLRGLLMLAVEYQHEDHVRALLSNNLNVILAALERAAKDAADG